MATPTSDTCAKGMMNDIDNVSLHSPYSSCSSSIHSETSTIHFSQDPWVEYKPRVEELCNLLWPPRRTIGQQAFRYLRKNRLARFLLPPPQIPCIERLRGGDYNRITGITLPSPYEFGLRRLVLRASRWDGGHPDREVAIMELVRQRTSIAIPRVIAKDFHHDNPLAKPYVIQERVSGGDLNSIWGNLSQAQKCTVACELGQTVRSLFSIESPIAGLIGPDASIGDSIDSTKIMPFEMKKGNGELIDGSSQKALANVDARPARETTMEFFSNQLGRWKAHAVFGEHERSIGLFDGLLKVVQEMEDLNLFNDDLHCLCHVDLHSRNIMAEVQSDHSIKITAILDWDEAVFAPKFVNCQPPWWLWEEDGDERLDENGWPTWPYELKAASDFPATAQKQELKRLFEEHAGPVWRHLAYDDHARLCRGLFILATEGLPSSEHYKAAERTLKDWEILRNSLEQ